MGVNGSHLQLSKRRGPNSGGLFDIWLRGSWTIRGTLDADYSRECGKVVIADQRKIGQSLEEVTVGREGFAASIRPHQQQQSDGRAPDENKHARRQLASRPWAGMHSERNTARGRIGRRRAATTLNARTPYSQSLAGKSAPAANEVSPAVLNRCEAETSRPTLASGSGRRLALRGD